MHKMAHQTPEKEDQNENHTKEKRIESYNSEVQDLHK